MILKKILSKCLCYPTVFVLYFYFLFGLKDGLVSILLLSLLLQLIKERAQ